LGDSVSTKSLPVDFILVDDGRAIESHPPARASKIAGTGIGPILLDL